MDQSDLTDTVRLQRLYSGRVVRRGAAEGCVAPEAILAVLQREGAETDRLATLEHVMSCAACHREYEWLRAVDEAVLEGKRAADGSGRRWWSRAAPLALAASLVLAAGTALLMTRRGAEVQRGEGGEIELIAPSDRVGPGGELTFVWRPLAGAPEYVVEVQRRDGSVAFSDTTADTTLSIAEPLRVLPGSEYRWWVRETTDGAEPRSSDLRRLRVAGR